MVLYSSVDESRPKNATPHTTSTIVTKTTSSASTSLFPLTGAGLGVTPAWDSLRHIELLLLVEEALGTPFTAEEIDSTHRYDDLVRLVARKQGMAA